LARIGLGGGRQGFHHNGIMERFKVEEENAGLRRRQIGGRRMGVERDLGAAGRRGAPDQCGCE
jgi:hypothetical protein